MVWSRDCSSTQNVFFQLPPTAVLGLTARHHTYLQTDVHANKRALPLKIVIQCPSVDVSNQPSLSCAICDAGPYWHAPPAGHRVRADRPREVAILDERGNLSGANHWTGLQTELDKLLADIQKEGLYTRHECNLCSQRVEISGQEFQVRGAVCDGLTAVRREKCATYGCSNGRCRTRGAR